MSLPECLPISMRVGDDIALERWRDIEGMYRRVWQSSNILLLI